MPNPPTPMKETAPGLYRYLVLLIGFITLAGASGVSSSFSVFYSTLLKEFDWSHAAAASLVGLAWMACSTLHSLGQFVLFYGGLSAVGQTALSLAMVVVSRWFQQTHRGRAIGLADVGTGFGHVVFVPGAAWLIATLGWRMA